MSEYRNSQGFDKEDYAYIERGDSSWSTASLAGMTIIAIIVAVCLLI